jgi:hypothetical protein
MEALRKARSERPNLTVLDLVRRRWMIGSASARRDQQRPRFNHHANGRATDVDRVVGLELGVTIVSKTIQHA